MIKKNQKNMKKPKEHDGKGILHLSKKLQAFCGFIGFIRLEISGKF